MGATCNSDTTTTTSTTFPSVLDIPPHTDMVNFFEGTHGRDATYYSGHAGGCNLWDSDLARSLTVVSISAADMHGGLSCGTCVKVTSMTRRSSGDVLDVPFFGIIGDLCEGCVEGDLDFALSGFDGRHDVTWQAIPCPVNNDPIQFRLVSSHTWFTKVQIRNARQPVQSVSVIGKTGDWVDFAPAGLGFFYSDIANVDDLIARPLEYPLTIRVCDIYGSCVTDRIEELKNDVDQVGLHQFPPSNSDGRRVLKDERVPQFPVGGNKSGRRNLEH